MSHKSHAVLLFLSLLLLLSIPAHAEHNEEGPAKEAIVLAAFGTSYPEALKSILHIREKIQAANPNIPVKLAFTSSIIRNIWQQRQDDSAWKKANPDVPEDVLYVKSPLATLADLSDQGYKDITVQSLHVFAGEEFVDLQNTLIGLRSIRTIKTKTLPFARLRLGRPALGMPGTVHPYVADIEVGAKAMKNDVEEAKKMDAALVYMGHGNDYFSTGIYAQFQHIMQQQYGYPVFVGCVEGFPGFD